MISCEFSGAASVRRTKEVSDSRSRFGDSTASLSVSFCVCESRMSVFVPVLGTCWTGGLRAGPACCHQARTRSHKLGCFSSFNLNCELYFITQSSLPPHKLSPYQLAVLAQ